MQKKSPNKIPGPGSSKSKKTSSKDKDRKRTIQQTGESSGSSSSGSQEKFLPNTSHDNRQKYPGFGPETIAIIAEQFLSETVPEEVTKALAEDISYKMREIIHAAGINMRQAKRKYLKVDDVNAVFKRLNLEPVYGPALPSWLTFGDPNGYTCISSKNVDLVETAQAEAILQEPGDVGLEYKWCKDITPINEPIVNNTLQKYSETIMKAIISKKDTVRTLALKDVSKNINIGLIIPHLCNFCFLILQKNITYSTLATPVLQLLEAITFNPCTNFSANEKQVTLLIYLLLENIMNATNNMLEDVYPICRTLGRLCMCWPSGGKIVVHKIKKHLPPEPVRRLTAPVISALNFIGNDALEEILWPNIEDLFKFITDMAPIDCLELHTSILDSARIFYKQEELNKSIHNSLLFEYGDRLVKFWNPVHIFETQKSEENDPFKWYNMKRVLLKTLKVQSRQETQNRTSQFEVMFKKPRDPIRQNKITIKGYKSLPIRQKISYNYMYQPLERKNIVDVITGRRTLLILQKNFISSSVNKNHGMMYVL